jgi:hypothetical protein
MLELDRKQEVHTEFCSGYSRKAATSKNKEL